MRIICVGSLKYASEEEEEEEEEEEMREKDKEEARRRRLWVRKRRRRRRRIQQRREWTRCTIRNYILQWNIWLSLCRCCIDSYVRWELPRAIQVVVVVFMYATSCDCCLTPFVFFMSLSGKNMLTPSRFNYIQWHFIHSTSVKSR